MLGPQVLVTLGKQIGPQFLRYPVLLMVPSERLDAGEGTQECSP